MNTETERTVIDHRVDSTQASSADVGETLGLTKQETKIVLSYTSLIKKLIEAAPIAPITGEAETHIRKRFPNNSEALEVINQDKIAAKALEFVQNSAFVYPAGNVQKDAPIPKAKVDFSSASMRVVASPADTDREVSYAHALRWLAQMRVQQEFKDVLSPVIQLVHHDIMGRPYMAPDETVDAVSADDTLKTLMA